MTLDSVLYSFTDWCIVKWEGESTYNCFYKDKLTAVERDLKLQPGEKVLVVYKGKPFKAMIAVTAGILRLRFTFS